MRTQLRTIAVILAIAVLALVSISPFLADGMILTDDGNLHLYRAIVLDDAIRTDGTLYPRYASALAYGYGASLFNYFPPTSYYPTVIAHALGADWVRAWELTIIFYVLLAGLGMYLWARQWVDTSGAWIATAGYLYAPYTLFDTVTRGSSNEFAGMALLPFALWGFTRLARTGARRDYLLAVFTYALFIIAHNVMTLYGSLLLVAYCGLLLFSAHDRQRVFWHLSSAGVFAVLMTAFFWLPALTETNFVKINGVLDNLPFVDVTLTLRTLADVFALPRTADPSQLQANVPISFSWVLLVPALVGFFLPQPRPPADQPRPILGLHLLLFGTLAIVIISQLRLSESLWQSVRLLQYSQFAWRPMSIGSLVLALLAGIGGSYALRLLANRRFRHTMLALYITLIIAYSIPWLYRPQIDLAAGNLRDAQDYEVQSQQPVLSSYGEYLPVQTELEALNPTYYTRDVTRIRPDEAYQITRIDEQGTRLNAEVIVTQTSILIIDWLYVPGWRAQVNGERVEVFATGEAGVLGLELPAGTHQVTVWYGQTTTQRVANLLSISALVLVLAFAWRLHSQRPASALAGDRRAEWLPLLVIVIVGCASFALKTIWIDRTNTPLRTVRLVDGALQGLAHPLAVNFGDALRLIGADAPTTAQSGGDYTLTLYWRLQDAPLDADYSVLAQIVDARDVIISETTQFYPGRLATRNWLTDYYLTDKLTLSIPEHTPPTNHHLQIGVFDSASGERLDVLNTQGNPIGQDALITDITITRPSAPPALEHLPLPELTVSGFDLLEVDALPDQAQVGEPFTLSWVWRANDPQRELQPQLLWQSAGEITVPVLVNGLSIDDWQAGDVWRGQHRLYIPPDLPADNYQLFVRVGNRSIALNQTMQITVPERNFDPPQPQVERPTRWQNGIQLLGYDRTEEGLRLYWQTEQLIAQELRLFVQIFDEDGGMRAISDGVPANGERATTGWLSGEIIVTEHALIIPEDIDTRWLVGWYNPLTGERVSLADETDDALILNAQP
ncbi:MAG: 6-pyruvoyl-tetrahydropterin synthase-related protein [Anaerolineae bacterium]